MITLNTPLKQIYRHPLGKDILDMLLRQNGKSARILSSPIAGSLRLSQLDKLAGKRLPGLAESIVNLLNNENQSPPAPPRAILPRWWKEAVFYQIYPRSFQDSNGDGIGDLAGIKSRIPYLKKLGVDAVWLSPIYDSPNDDMGYDIRNYRKIMKEFGNLRDFNSLLAELHKNDIKLIMDLVVNHTSDEHEWFQCALKDPDGPYKDYYFWANGNKAEKPGLAETPPNNWVSFFSGSAWNHYPETGQWALHTFSKKQMDLNWENPQTRADIYEMVNWWLEKGVDGFRLDVISLISKGSLADGNPAIGAAFGGMVGIEHYFYGPRLHEYLREMHEEAFAPHKAFTIGETVGLGMEASKLLSAEGRGELDMVFNFDHLENPGKSRVTPYEYDLRQLKPLLLKWQTGYGNNCWQALFFENHDNPRMTSKINPDPAYRLVLAKLLAVLQLTLKGSPFIYQGQELGMTNTTFQSPEDFRDVEAINRYHELAAGGAQNPGEAFAQIAWGTRDHARVPMQWNSSLNAGFTTGTPWIGVNPNFPVINAENEMANPLSVFNFFKNLIALRKKDKTLVYGAFQPVFPHDKNTLCYFRASPSGKYYVEINLTGEDVRRPGPISRGHIYLFGSYSGVSRSLRPYEANLYRIANP